MEIHLMFSGEMYFFQLLFVVIMKVLANSSLNDHNNSFKDTKRQKLLRLSKVKYIFF